MPKIEKIFAFIFEEESDDEGIIATCIKDKWMPLIGADMDRAKSLHSIAQEVSNGRRKNVTLVEFSVRKTIEVITPKNN